MIAHIVQRWRQRQNVFRSAGEVIQTRYYDVAAIPDDRTAKAFVGEHHYSGTYPAARFRFGLYRGQQLQGVAVFSHPCNNAVLTTVFAAPILLCVELGRFVLLDEVPANGETWFLGRCFYLLRREGIVGVVSFADPEPRRAADGQIVFPGHIGTIYQAHNAVYLGRATPRRLRLLPDGSVLSDCAIQKLRSREKGWRYAAQQLIAAGADEPSADLREWALHWIDRLTRLLRHGGNHKYAWGLHHTIRRSLPSSRPYPKWSSAADVAKFPLHRVSAK